MLLTGTYSRALDEKHRLAIPKPLRDALGGKQIVLFVAPGSDGSLGLYTEGVLANMAKRLSDTPHDQDSRAFGRLFYAQAQRVETDSQGRIRIPPDLAETAALAGEVILLGVHDHMEVWNPARWGKYLEAKQPYYDEIAAKAFAPKT